MTAGLTNYASAYATGLLLSRRLLAGLKMDTLYKGNTNVDGNYYSVEDLYTAEKLDRRPFKAVLDIGLVATTTGNKVFGAMKGACDGGLYIPHSESRFPGHYDEDGEKGYEPEVLRDRIFGAHVDNYMNEIRGDSARFTK